MILEIKGSPRVAELVSCLNIRRSTLGAPLLPSGLNYNELLGHLRKRGIGIPFRKYEYAILQAREYLSHGFLVTQKSFFHSFPFHSTPLFQCHIQCHIVFKNHEIAVLRNVVAKERDK